MTDRYVLNAEGEPIPEPDLLRWAEWFENAHNRRLAEDHLPETVRVSTIFLGLDHSFGSGFPILWETMIFGGKHDGYQERYSSREDALAGHALAVKMASEEGNTTGDDVEAEK